LKFHTSLRALNKLMGGFHTGKPCILYGPFKCGKSIMSMQLGCEISRDVKYGGMNKPALIYDSETFWTEDVFKTWYSFFRNRWKDLPIKPKIDVIQLNSIYDAARELGFNIVIRRHQAKTEPVISFPKRERRDKATGKVIPVKETTQEEDWLERSPMWKKISKKDYGLVVIDSFSILFKDVFESVQQNFPGRASSERVFLSGLRSLAQRRNLIVLIISHETGNVPWGGESLPYYVKNIFGLFKADKLAKAMYGDTEEKEKKGQPYDTWTRVRKLYRYRHPYLPDGAYEYVKLVLNRGFEDI